MQTANAPSSLAPPVPAKSGSQHPSKLDPVDMVSPLNTALSLTAMLTVVS